MQDFEIIKSLEHGKAMQIRKRDNDQLYALKRFRKPALFHRLKLQTHSKSQSDQFSLSQFKNSFLVPVRFVFQSPESIYLVSACVHGGDNPNPLGGAVL